MTNLWSPDDRVPHPRPAAQPHTVPRHRRASEPVRPSGETAPRLSTSKLCVGHGAEPIVRDVDLDVAAGGLTILVGPNGCGKSTLLKAMARVLRPLSGEVRLDGRPLHSIPTREVARALAVLPQGPIAPEGLRVRELVGQGRFPHQSLLRQWSREDARAVDEAMAAAQVTELAERPVATLSGGQRQRCWIAMVLAQETDLILLDEPTTFLDLKVQVDVTSLLARTAHERGRTLLIVLHELNLAAAFADHLVMMRDGVIVDRGAPAEVFTAANLARTFELDALVMADPERGRPICIPRLSNAPVVRA